MLRVPDHARVDFERLFLGLPTAYLVMTRDLVIVEANEAYLELLGRTREELVRRYVFDAFPPPRTHWTSTAETHCRSPSSGCGTPGVRTCSRSYDVTDHVAGRRVERYWSVVSAPLLGEDGTASLVLQRVEDVTDYGRERANRRTDLTGDEERERRVLAVEADLYVRLQQLGAARAAEGEVGTALRASEQRARAVLDTAVVNDSLGHDAGDELLVQTAERLRAVVRCEDLVARLGGDEFVVLCEDLPDPGDAEAVASRIVEALKAPVHVHGRDLPAPASVGVVTDVGERTASELLRDADAAMYQAKKQGRGRYALLDDLARRSAVERMQLADDLHLALESSQLRACYQPVVGFSTGEIVAAEALVRWHHPTRGVLSPASFLAIADEVGLLPELDEWMISTACADAAAWGRALRRDIGVSVNVSASSLTGHDLVERVGGVAQGAGLAPGLLTLEATEGALMQAAGSTVTALEHLRQLDVRLAVDGFGTGFSSLRYRQKLPVRSLKVDRSFVGALDAAADEVARSSAVVRAIVSFAAGLDVDAVAEGIETPGQLAAVRELGCHIGQGYLLARPAPASDLLVAAQDGATLLTSAGPGPRSSRSSKARRRRRPEVAQR